MARLVLLLLSLLAAACGDEEFDLTIVHINDTHSHLNGLWTRLTLDGAQTQMEIGGFPRLIAKVGQIRRQTDHSLVLHAGDAFQGTLHFVRRRGLSDAELLNMMPLDAMALGNHEFDRGPGVLARFGRAARFPLLAANIDVRGAPELAGLVQPIVIKSYGGVQVGIIGLITTDTVTFSLPGPGITFSDPLEAAQDAVWKLRFRGVDKIIVLSHLGYGEDLKLAEELEGVDVIVGGHSHTLLGDFAGLGLRPRGDYPTEVYGAYGARVCVVQAWEQTKLIGVLDVHFDALGQVRSCTGRPRILTSDSFAQVKDLPQRQRLRDAVRRAPLLEVIEADPTAGARLVQLDRDTNWLKGQVLGQVTRDLRHVQAPGDYSAAAGVHLPAGSQVAPLIARALLWKSAATTGLQAQAVFTYGGAPQADLRRGVLTASQVYQVLPYEFPFSVLWLRGSRVIAALEHGLYKGGWTFPYTAGLRFSADLSRPPGQRVVSAELEATPGSWTTVDPAATYRVGTTSLLAGGVAGYSFFLSAKPRIDTDFTDVQALIEYADAHGGLGPVPSTMTLKK